MPYQDHVAGSLWISFICFPNLCSMVFDCLHLSPKCLFILFMCILSHVYLLYLFVPDIQHEDHVAMICRMLFLPAKDLCHVDKSDDCTRNHRKLCLICEASINKHIDPIRLQSDLSFLSHCSFAGLQGFVTKA